MAVAHGCEPNNSVFVLPADVHVVMLAPRGENQSATGAFDKLEMLATMSGEDALDEDVRVYSAGTVVTDARFDFLATFIDGTYMHSGIMQPWVVQLAEFQKLQQLPPSGVTPEVCEHILRYNDESILPNDKLFTVFAGRATGNNVPLSYICKRLKNYRDLKGRPVFLHIAACRGGLVVPELPRGCGRYSSALLRRHSRPVVDAPQESDCPQDIVVDMQNTYRSLVNRFKENRRHGRTLFTAQDCSDGTVQKTGQLLDWLRVQIKEVQSFTYEAFCNIVKLCDTTGALNLYQMDGLPSRGPLALQGAQLCQRLEGSAKPKGLRKGFLVGNSARRRSRSRGKTA